MTVVVASLSDGNLLRSDVVVVIVESTYNLAENITKARISFVSVMNEIIMMRLNK